MLFYPELFKAVHTAVEETLTDAGIPIHDLLKRGLGLPVVDTEARYGHPLTYGDDVAIDSRRRSFPLAELFNHDGP